MRKASRASRRALRDAAADAHHHLDRGRRDLGGRAAWRAQPDLMRDTLLAVIMIIMNGMVGVTLLDRRHQASRADVQSAGRQRLSQRPPAARDLRPDHAGLHADDPGPDLFGPSASRPGDRLARPLPPLSRSADRALSRLLRGRRPHGCGGARGRLACLVLDRDAGRPTWRPSSISSSNSGRRSTTCSKLCRRRRRSGASSLRSLSRRPSRSAR